MLFLRLSLVLGVVALSSGSNGPKRLYKHRLDDNQQLIAPLADPFDGIEYRLPNETKPIHYNIWLTTDVHRGEFAFSGQVTILIDALVNANQITLHHREIEISNVNLMSETGDPIQSNVPFTSVPATEFLVITPTAPLIALSKYQVQITYSGSLRDDNAGFYHSSYVNPAGETVWLATTQFESTDARHAFPW